MIGRNLSRFDVFHKAKSEFQVHTMYGGIVSLISFLAMLYLIYSEYQYATMLEIRDYMTVDGSRNRPIALHFEIDFPRMPCSLLSIVSEDIAMNDHVNKYMKNVGISNLNIVDMGSFHS